MQTVMEIADSLKILVSEFARRSAEEIKLEAWLSDYVADSLSFVIFREQCERRFHIVISDAEWAGLRSLMDILDLIKSKSSTAGSTAWAQASPRQAPSSFRNGRFEERVEVSMPLLGINNLAETPLLKYIGDLRWRHIQHLTGVKSRDLVDASGNRLYPAFFYVELEFPESRPMAGFGENDCLLMSDQLKRYGGSMIDGVTALIPAGSAVPEGERLTVGEFAQAGIPAVRLTNLFVMKFSGAEWLRKSRPDDSLLDGLPEMQWPPDSYEFTKQASQRGHIDSPAYPFVELQPEYASFTYHIQPERDVNGVGLLYFANYPLFLDLAEREALHGLTKPWPPAAINKRSLLSRRIAYLNNAVWSDTLRIESKLWMRDPRSLAPGERDVAPVEIVSQQRIYRESDSRLMSVSSSRKILSGISMYEVPWEPCLSVTAQ